MKKLSLLLAMVMVLTLGLAACQTDEITGDGTTTGDEGAVTEPGEEGEEAVEGEIDEIFFDPDQFQVKALDDQTLEVTLAARTPYFLELTAFPAFSPVKKDIVDQYGDSWATNADTYIGNGPYKVTDWVTSSHITMEKNEHYWDYENLGPDVINFNLIEDDNAQYNGFQTGALSFIDEVPLGLVDSLKEEAEFHVMTQLGTYYVSFNNQAEPFTDPLVRQAFTLAIDRDYLANVVGNGLYVPAGAFVPPSLSDASPSQEFRTVGGDYYDPSASAYEENLAQAKELLKEAGYENGEGLPAVTYIYNDTTLHKNVAEALQSMWGELGATVSLEVQEWSTFLNSRKNGDYQAARDGWLADYNDPISFLDMFVTGSGNNNAQWSNAEFDALIAEILTTEDAAERMQKMHQAEDIMFDEWVVSPVMYYADLYMQDTALDSSVWASPLGFKYFMYADHEGQLEVCVGPNPDTIDPALNSAVDGATMIIHAFEGLYKLDKDGVPEPSMAQSVEISDDGLTYTFTLREGIAWSDGTPITAQDFVDSWVRAINPETAADYSYMFECIAGFNDAIGGEIEH